MTNAVLPPCDETAGQPSSNRPCPDKRGTLIATVAGSSLAFVVGSIINVALPAMQDEFGVGATGAQWIVNAYLLPLGAFVLIGGAVGDHWGRKRVFQTGLIVFAVACVLCAVAWSFPVLLAGRVLEGLGAAMIAPTSLAIIADGFSGSERGRAVGTWAGAGAAAGAAAPLVGGLIVDGLGWRWAFVAVVPVAFYASWVTRRSVRESRAERGDRAPLDWLGAGLIGSGLLGLIWALIALPERGPTPAVVVAGLVGGVLLAGFLVVEQRKGDAAMTPLGLFASRTFSGLSVLTLLLYLALGGLLVLLPYVLIRDLGYGATAAGAAVLPLPVVLAVLSRTVGGTVVARVGTRLLLTVGPALVAVGFVVLALLPSDDVVYARHILPGLMLLALGMSASVAPLTSAVLASAGEGYSGVASGVNNAISRIAGLLATALLGLVLIGSADDLTAGLATAAWVGAALAALGAASAWLLIDPETVETGPPAGEPA